MELAKLIKYLDKKFNPKLASNWDNVGFQIFSKKQIDISRDIKKVMICLDVTNDVANFAIKNKIDLIISRHPFIFNELKDEKKIKKELIKKLTDNNIDVFSIHTNYDASPNQGLIELLSIEFDINKTKRFGSDQEGYEIKLKKDVKSKDMIDKLNKLFNTKITEINDKFDLDNNVKEFYIVTGSGGGTMIEENLKDSYFITGEIKWNELVYANDNNVSTLVLGHYMEQYFVEHLQKMISNNFNKEIEVDAFDIKNQIKNYK